MKDDSLYLIHILECITRIEQYTLDGRARFMTDLKTQDAVLRNLQTLSEPTQRLSPSLQSQNSHVRWQEIGGFGNVLVHDYLGLNLARVWEIVEHGLPELKGQIAAIFRELEKPQQRET